MLRSEHDIPQWIGSDPALTRSLVMTPQKDEWVLTDVVLSTIQHPAYPCDPGVLAAIKEFWPQAIYMRRIWTYKNSEGKIKNYSRHAFGSYVEFPSTSKKDRYVEMPAICDYPKPNQVDVDLIYGGPVPFGEPTHPGNYVKLDWVVYYYLREIYDEKMSEKERYVKFIKNKMEEEVRRKEKLIEELNYCKRDVDRWALKKLAEFSDVEITEYMNSLAEARKQQQIEFQIMAERANRKPVRLYLGKGEA